MAFIQRSIVNGGGNVEWQRPELKLLCPIYFLIKDCMDGEQAIKTKRDKYLPKPNAEDLSPANAARYQAYLTRAVFYNVSARTLNGMVGQVFLREPQITLPKGLEPLLVDATGSRVKLTQLAQRAVGLNLAFGRLGLLADYPQTQGGATVSEIEKGEIQPTINAYDPWDIINWRTIIRGAKQVLSLLVLRERYSTQQTDSFEVKQELRYRVLRLNTAGNYSVELWTRVLPDSISGGGWFISTLPFEPKDVNGNPFNEIPFTFVGAVDNDATVDNPPMYDLASLNIAHYRNSADYEEAAYMLGQPTPWFSGLTEAWVKSVLGGKIQLGSRAAVALPPNASAGLLQVNENTMPKEAMDQKEKQMVALGAKLVEQSSIQRTATEAGMDYASDTSTLATVTKNVADGFNYVLKQAAKFTGDADTEIKFNLNTEFDLTQMSAADRAEVIREWQASAITFAEMRAVLKRGGIATEDDAEAMAKIAAELAQVTPQIVGPGGAGA